VSAAQENWQMKIAVSSEGNHLDATTSPVFGRCPFFVFVDPETMAFETVPNLAVSEGGGAGVQAAQFAVNRGIDAVLTGNLGPNAFDVLQAANVPGYVIPAGTVRQAVDAYNTGRLQPMSRANVAAHAGMGRGGRRAGMVQVVESPAPTQSHPAKELELEKLHETLQDLRQRLAETMDKIEKLEKEK
jgi:predicted Fe-Mo cluster-binding NifX family protein